MLDVLDCNAKLNLMVIFILIINLFKLVNNLVEFWCVLNYKKVLHSRNVLRPNKLIGSFKLDVATVFHQKGGFF